jgi:hypothetical protein
MTKDEEMTPSGEQRLRTRRNALLRYAGIGMIAAFVVGIGTGALVAGVDGASAPPWLLVTGWTAVIAAFVWFSRRYLQRVDEVDLLDNLWASSIGLYGYVVAFFSWQLFYDANLVSEPDHGLIFSGTLVFTLLVYVLRKLGLR